MRHLNPLPIWRGAHPLLLAIGQALRPFPRNHTLGTELHRQAMPVCRLSMRAADQSAGQAPWLALWVVAIDDLNLSVPWYRDLEASCAVG